MAMAKKAEFLSNKPLGEDLFVPMVASEQSSSAVANSQKKMRQITKRKCAK